MAARWLGDSTLTGSKEQVNMPAMTRWHYTNTLTETQMVILARRLAPAVGRGLQIHLHGDLGAGKTTMVRALLQSLGHQGRVKSPTYGLIEPYSLPLGKAYHLDLYRLADPEELEYLGIEDLLAEQALLLVEWPERGRGQLPEPDLQVMLMHGPSARQLTLTAMTLAGLAIVDQAIAVQSLFNNSDVKQLSGTI